MKQYIDESQWADLSQKQRETFEEYLGYKCDQIWVDITIGEMIEYLGKHLTGITIVGENIKLIRENDLALVIPFIEGELCNALWEAVKLKLQND